MVGRLKLGIFRLPVVVEPAEAAGLRTLNGEAAVLFPNGVVLAAASDNPVAITVILA